MFLTTTAIYSLLHHRAIAARLQLAPSTLLTLAAVLIPLGTLLAWLLLWWTGLLAKIRFDSTWAPAEVLYSPIFYFGIIPSSFAALGLLYLLTSNTIRSRLIILWFCYTLAAIYLYYLIDVSIFIPCPRLFYFYLLSVAVLAGFGVYAVYTWTTKHTPRGVHIMTLIGITCVVGIHLWTVSGQTTTLPSIITPEQYVELQRITDTYNANLIITDPLTAIAVYPATGARVTSLLNNNLGGGNSQATRAFLSNPSCAEKRVAFGTLTPLLQSESVQDAPFLVLSKTPLNCEFLQPIESNLHNVFLYHSGSYTVRAFQRDNDTILLPTPTAIDGTPPNGTLTTDAALRELLSGNTIANETFAEYYHPDGRLSGWRETPYTGVWTVEAGQFCYHVYESGVSGCRLIANDNNQLTFYYPDGSVSSRATWSAGKNINQPTAP